MVNVKTIKDVDEETWSEFKSLAARNKLKMGTFFKLIIKEHEKSSQGFWENLLKGEKIFTDKEAEEMKETVKKIRNEYGFRK